MTVNFMKSMGGIYKTKLSAAGVLALQCNVVHVFQVGWHDSRNAAVTLAMAFTQC